MGKELKYEKIRFEAIDRTRVLGLVRSVTQYISHQHLTNHIAPQGSMHSTQRADCLFCTEQCLLVFGFVTCEFKAIQPRLFTNDYLFTSLKICERIPISKNKHKRLLNTPSCICQSFVVRIVDVWQSFHFSEVTPVTT